MRLSIPLNFLFTGVLSRYRSVIDIIRQDDLSFGDDNDIDWESDESIKETGMGLREILGQAKFAQVGFVVNDIEETKKKYALLFDCVAPEAFLAGEYEVTQTKVYGEPAPDANCKLAFFDLTPGVQLELIEPNEEPSVWRDHLNKYGEGIHHIAFQVTNGDAVIERLKNELGAVVEQEGNYGDGSGRYVYLSLQDSLKCRIELLESFE